MNPPATRGGSPWAESFFRRPNQQDRECGNYDCDHKHDKRAHITTGNVMEKTKERRACRADGMTDEYPQTAHRSKHADDVGEETDGNDGPAIENTRFFNLRIGH